MGFFISKLYNNKEYKILLLGLEGTGKTSILNLLETPDNIQIKDVSSQRREIIPTIGFNIGHIEFNKRNITIWDLSGNISIRKYWKCYYSYVDGVVFLIDASSKNTKEESFELIKRIAKENELKNSTILVLLNKTDLNNFISYEEVESVMDQFNTTKKYGIFGCNIFDKTSVILAFDWLIKNI
ncbi:ADP-ribosylation factor 1 [Astathelohania contejeani]|uniref:ADP-ribosylation factor 1 n=1 Tax=Astathelohania contejeani TaxID=164912 RepID=A0ABQ7HXB6_9MICR|nr:ADP-ribosylation factor 1 [Thelohania contejeani]